MAHEYSIFHYHFLKDHSQFACQDYPLFDLIIINYYVVSFDIHVDIIIYSMMMGGLP